VELTDHNRWIYDEPSIGRGDPGTGSDDYLATPERIASWVAELAGSVVGLTGVFEPARRNYRRQHSAARREPNDRSWRGQIPARCHRCAIVTVGFNRGRACDVVSGTGDPARG